MPTLKLIPHLLSYAGIVLVLLRAFAGRRLPVAVASLIGFVVGIAGAVLLFRFFPGEPGFGLVRDVVGGGFLLFWGVAVTAVYRSTGHDLPMTWWDNLLASPAAGATAAFTASLVAGAVCACRLSSGDSLVTSLLLVLAAALLVFGAHALERQLPAAFAVAPAGLMAVVVALLVFSSASIIRLDLFSPLTMKVMKFAHDFVHQFFESMLIPDHLFIRSNLWGYIGLLFGKEIGFWGALVILLVPVFLVLLSINFEPLPQVAHIRQGAQRRRLLAEAIGSRRRRLVIPGLSLVILAAAVYRSLYPSVEYWDPKPVPVTATPAGEIFIPKKGEIDLEDGKLHKYLYKAGGKEARFFVVMTPAGKLSVDLDACAICKPDGYGQAEGTVICYYCKTLIPMETVGKPGGCNPVPVPFTVRNDGVHLDAMTIINTWGSTVQATARVKEAGK